MQQTPTAMAGGSQASGTTASPSVSARASINGNNGPTSPIGTALWAVGNHTLELTGLTGGGSITVACQAWAGAPANLQAANCMAQINAFAVFLR